MKAIIIPFLAATLSTVILFAKEEASQTPPAQKVVEVCFVLDTTGSMSGLIEGAKQKIWSIANDIGSASPRPDVRFGLVGYRDRGDAYVTKSIPLTNDLDAIYDDLQKFHADGGGDEPESVGEALHEAVTTMKWSDDPGAFRVIYLVGDAPPQKYPDGKDWSKACHDARKKDILINTIQCGNLAGTAEIWKSIASDAGGAFAVIPQDGNMQHVSAPQDKELLDLNIKIGATLIPCGSERLRQSVVSKQAAAEAASAVVNASRLSYNSKTEKAVQGEGELIDALKAGTIRLDEVKASDLPENLRSLTPEKLKEHVTRLQAEREDIQKRLAQLVKERDDYLLTERLKQAASGKTDSFDEQVRQTLREQAAAKGMLWE